MVRLVTKKQRRKGMLAGINCATNSGEEAWVPRRDEAYLGVLVDDLVTKGYRNPIVCSLAVLNFASVA